MPTYTTITENRDGSFSVQVHDADALRRIQAMCDLIREDDDDPADDERNATADYAEDLYRVIDDALTADDRADDGDTRRIATESRGLINDAALSHHLHHTGTA